MSRYAMCGQSQYHNSGDVGIFKTDVTIPTMLKTSKWSNDLVVVIKETVNFDC